MFRVGIGYDIHELVEGRALILGGVNIPFDKGLLGHSDADVLCHAVTDALLGAACLGNIGQCFPDTDPQYKGADSLELLATAAAMLRDAGYSIVNIDSNIVAQEPKLNPHVDEMRAKIAESLKIGVEQVSIKPRTNEGVGPEGRKEAISAQAIVLLQKD